MRCAFLGWVKWPYHLFFSRTNLLRYWLSPLLFTNLFPVFGGQGKIRKLTNGNSAPAHTYNLTSYFVTFCWVRSGVATLHNINRDEAFPPTQRVDHAEYRTCIWRLQELTSLFHSSFLEMCRQAKVNERLTMNCKNMLCLSVCEEGRFGTCSIFGSKNFLRFRFLTRSGILITASPATVFPVNFKLTK